MWRGESTDPILDACRSDVSREVLRILANSDRGAYPSQLARRLGKHRTLVNRRLRALHELGLVRRRYEVRDGKGVMVYRSAQRTITIAVDFKEGRTSVTRSESDEMQLTLRGRIATWMSRVFPPAEPLM